MAEGQEMNQLINLPVAYPPTPVEMELAVESSRQLARVMGLCDDHSSSVQVSIQIGQANAELKIPLSALRMFSEILGQMSQGNAVTLIPSNADLTTQQAADLLGVSRPFLVAQLDAGALPCRKVGTHRRVTFKDLMLYKQTMDNKRLEALAELTKQAQELDMGY